MLMKTLEYDWKDGTHTTFDDYTIGTKGVIRNNKGHVMSRSKNSDGYYRVGVSHDGSPRVILVGRALASTFLGPPQTLYHTADTGESSVHYALNNDATRYGRTWKYL